MLCHHLVAETLFSHPDTSVCLCRVFELFQRVAQNQGLTDPDSINNPEVLESIAQQVADDHMRTVQNKLELLALNAATWTQQRRDIAGAHGYTGIATGTLSQHSNRTGRQQTDCLLTWSLLLQRAARQRGATQTSSLPTKRSSRPRWSITISCWGLGLAWA